MQAELVIDIYMLFCCCFLYLNSLKPNGQNFTVTRERMMSVIITMHQNISGQNETDYIKKEHVTRELGNKRKIVFSFCVAF